MKQAWKPNRTSHAAITFNVTATVALAFAMSVGCVSRPLPPRPTIGELVQESLDSTLPDFEIENVAGPNHWEDVYDLKSGEVIIDQQVIEDRVVDEPVIHQSAIQQTAADDDYFLETQPIIRASGVSSGEPVLFDEEFIETDVREVLLTMAEHAGIDLIMDEQVRGVVNSRLNNLSTDRAIEKVLMPLGLHVAKRGDQYYVAPADPESPLFSKIAERVEYRPKHLDTKALIDTVPKGFAPFVQEIAGSNLIVVEAPNRIATEIVDRFAGIDQPIPQVILEAIICVVSPESGFQFGLDWQHAVELNGENALKFGAAGLAISSNYSQAGANSIFDDFAQTSTFIKLLNEYGYLTIRASPHVMAQDNKKATIAINRETFFSVQPQSANNADNSAFFFQQNIQTVQSGISLDITPRIRGDVVTIDIEKAEVSEDVRSANTELALNPYPIINRRSVSTTVHVKDGKTIVIGGLVQRETIDKVNRIPGLSKIPLLGYLFETTQRSTRDAEVVIFISPRIVQPCAVP